ncbi:hypothetical protein Tsubulata_010970 [Turnera subulata]|uniref:PHD-type domain-containing protein n=1 Tax=Turnera subulata TaxID=218843 RepID=A0A9Q0GC76_9ROSI|nr:hypothetical protein Tsubulata_010970 [Turnera subulata]
MGKKDKAVAVKKKGKQRRQEEEPPVLLEDQEEEEEEDLKNYDDWCFVCKDGGELILCDNGSCPYVYHPGCVGMDDSVIHTNSKWICSRHFCHVCEKTPKMSCLVCPYSVCARCAATAGFLTVRGNTGLCGECFELVMAVDADEGFDADGNQIDVEDNDTFEGLFSGYWDIVKEKERLTLTDVYQAEARMRKGQTSKCTKKSYKTGKRKRRREAMPSDGEWDDPKEIDAVPKRKWDDPEEIDAVPKRKTSEQFEYIGWGSKPLLDFLTSLGNDTTKEISQVDVDSIIWDYIQNHKLFDPKNRKRILCDERLYPIFKREVIDKNKIYDLLDIHFASNVEQSEEDNDRNADEGSVRGKSKAATKSSSKWWNKVEKSFPGDNPMAIIPYEGPAEMPSFDEERTEVEKFQESRFASIVYDNIKLVYLRRSLIEEFLNDPDTLEAKVVGCFVKVKYGSADIQRFVLPLSQVTGIKYVTSAEHQSEILLSLSGASDVVISRLSDISLKEGKPKFSNP